MKKIISVLLVLCFSLSMLFAVDIATVKWALKTPKNVNYIRYQVNDEKDDAWTVIENNKTGYNVVDIDSPVDLPSTLYVQQSLDNIVWSESASKTVSASVVQSVYDKTHIKDVVIRVPNINYEMDIDSAFATDDMTENIDETAARERAMQIQQNSSAFKFTFLVKPTVSINLQKVIALNNSQFWQDHSTNFYTDPDGFKENLSYNDLAPRLDFDFRFENIAGKKSDIFGFDVGFSVGYETRPYLGWDQKVTVDREEKSVASSYFMDPEYWYHKISLDVRLGGGLNLANGLVRPYFGLGAGADLILAKGNAEDNTSYLKNFALFGDGGKFTLMESTEDAQTGKWSLGMYIQPYVLGNLGVRFTFGDFTFGVEGTYKVYVVGTNAETDLWHKVDAALALGGTWSI